MSEIVAVRLTDFLIVCYQLSLELTLALINNVEILLNTLVHRLLRAIGSRKINAVDFATTILVPSIYHTSPALHKLCTSSALVD